MLPILTFGCKKRCVRGCWTMTSNNRTVLSLSTLKGRHAWVRQNFSWLFHFFAGSLFFYYYSRALFVAVSVYACVTYPNFSLWIRRAGTMKVGGGGKGRSGKHYQQRRDTSFFAVRHRNRNKPAHLMWFIFLILHFAFLNISYLVGMPSTLFSSWSKTSCCLHLCCSCRIHRQHCAHPSVTYFFKSPAALNGLPSAKVCPRLFTPSPLSSGGDKQPEPPLAVSHLLAAFDFQFPSGFLPTSNTVATNRTYRFPKRCDTYFLPSGAI